jgi:hypothetical protein
LYYHKSNNIDILGEKVSGSRMNEDGDAGKTNEPSTEEADLMQRSTKKQKGGGTSFLPPRTQKSYKDSLIYPTGDWEQHSDTNMTPPPEEVLSDDEELMDDKYPSILLSRVEKLRIRAPWRSALIIKAIGKSVGFKFMDYKVRTLWKLQGEMQMIDLGMDFFLLRFKLQEDYWHVVNGGPWFVKQQFLSVRCWTPGFRPSEAKISTTAVWIRLPELPIELYDTGLLRRIGNQLGQVLKIDARTSDNVRGRYARLCIQIDLDQPLIPKIRIGELLQRIQYEGISSLCVECGCMGHKAASCPSKILPINAEVQQDAHNTENPTMVVQNQAEIGDWMLVTRRKPFSGKKKQSSKSTSQQGTTPNTMHGNSVKPGMDTHKLPKHTPPADSILPTTPPFTEPMLSDSDNTTTLPTRVNVTSNPSLKITNGSRVKSDPRSETTNGLYKDKVIAQTNLKCSLSPHAYSDTKSHLHVETPQVTETAASTGAEHTILVTNTNTQKTTAVHAMDLDQNLTNSKTILPPQPTTTPPFPEHFANHQTAENGSSYFSTPSQLKESQCSIPTPKEQPAPRAPTPTNPLPRVRTDSVSTQLGADPLRSSSPHRRSASQMASTMPEPILETGGSSHGTILEGPDTSTATKHSVWPNHCQPLHIPIHCMPNNDSPNGTATTLERTTNGHQRTDAITNPEHGEQLRLERCRSPRSHDVHHLPREHTTLSPIPGEVPNSHSGRGSPASPLFRPLNEPHPNREQFGRHIPSGPQPSDESRFRDIQRLSTPRCDMEEEGTPASTGSSA